MTQRSSRWPVAQKLTEMTSSLPWMRAVMAVCLCVLSLCGGTSAAGMGVSASSIDIKQFTPSDELNKYWMFMDSTITASAGSFGTATQGYVGAGSYLQLGTGSDTFKTPTRIKGAIKNNSTVGYFLDTLLANSDVEVYQGSFSKKGILQVSGKLTLGNPSYDSANTWVAGTSSLSQNVKLYNDYHANGNVFAGFQVSNGGTLFLSTGASIDYPENINGGTTLTNQTFSPPVNWKSLPWFDSTSFPGYNLSAFSSATVAALGTLTTISNLSDITTICTSAGVTCDTVKAHTINGVSLPDGYILPSGYYGKMNVSNPVIYLGEGVYYFDEVNLNNTGAMLIAVQKSGGRTVVFANNGFNTRSGSIFVGPDSAVGAVAYGSDASKKEFLGGTMMIVSGPHSNVYFDSDAKIWATLCAPTGRIEANSQLHLFGQMFGRHFNGPNSSNQFSGAAGAFISFNPSKPVIGIANTAGLTVPEDDATYKLKISIPAGNTWNVTFNYTTAVSVKLSDGTVLTGTAVAGTNFKDTTGTITINKNTLDTVIPFRIMWDHAYTGNLTFYLNLTNPSMGVFGTGDGVTGDTNHVAVKITILDKDLPPTLRVRDTALFEGNITSGKRDTTVFKFAVSLSDTSDSTKSYTTKLGSDVIFSWHTVDSSATIADSDYIAASGTDTIKAGTTTDTIRVKILGDNRYENNESFKVVIDSTSLKLALKSSQMKLVGIGTIKNDDGRPRLALTDTGYFEGSADSVRSLYVHLVDSATGKLLDASSAPEVPINFTWATSDGTGTGSAAATLADNDYVNVKGSVTDSVRANRWIDTINVTTKGDLRYEPDENFLVTLIPGLNAYPTAGNTVSHDTLRNDDNQPIVQIVADTSRMKTIGLNKGFLEGAAGQNPPDTAYFIVKLITQADGKSLLPLKDLPAGGMSYLWTTIDGTAIGRISGKSTADTDYVALSGSRKIIGNNVDTIKVPIIGDNKYENNETFSVQLSKLTNYSDTSSRNILSATATILNDDSLPRLQVVGDSHKEGDAGVHTSWPFTVRLVDINGKPLTLADAPEVPVQFTWLTNPGTAKFTSGVYGDTDFVPQPKTTAQVDSGNVSVTLSNTIIGDFIYEGIESFSVVVTPKSGADSSGTFTIIDDDEPPTLKLSGVALPEGNQNTVTSFNFLGKLSYAPSLKTTIWWHTLDGTATVADGDYQPKGAGAFKDMMTTIDAGKDTVSLTVYVNGDSKLEPDEYFSIKVDSIKVGTIPTTASVLVNNALVPKDTAVGTILNDDAMPFIQVKSPTVANQPEGTPPLTPYNVLKFPVVLVDSLGQTLTSSLGVDVTYSWSTVDSSGLLGASAATKDFQAIVSKLDTIKAGSLSDTLIVTIIPDSTYENPESFRVQLANVVNADTTVSPKTTSPTGVTTAVGTIYNDDLPPVLSVRDTFVTEPATAADPDSLLVFTYHLSSPSGVPVIFKSWTEGVTANTPVAGSDYVEIPTTHWDTIQPGKTVAYDIVKVHGDAIYEGPETLRLKLSNPSNVSFAVDPVTKKDTFSTAGVIGTIRDEDPPPVLHIDTVVVSEGSVATFTVSLVDGKTGKSVRSGRDVTFDWTTADSTAKVGGDYIKGSGIKVLIPKGAPSVSITVTTQKDGIANEDTLFYKVILSNPVNAMIGDTGLGGILDQDLKPTLSIDSAFDTEGKPLVFHVKLSGPSAKPISLIWSTSEGGIPPKLQARSSGTDPDYVGVANASYVLRAGILDTTLTVTTIDNVVDDPDTLFLKVPLAAATAKDASLFTFGNKVGYGGIIDNDLPPSVTINDTSVQEPADSGKIAYAVSTIHLSSKSSQSVTVYFHTYPGTAHSSGSSIESPDYKDTTGTLLLLPGQLDSTINITVYGDNIYEGNEFFYVKIDSVKNADTGTKTRGTVTILDNDVAPTISVGTVSTSEPGLDASDNLLPPTAVEIPVHLSHSSGLPVTFTWSTHDTGSTTPINMRAKHTKESLVPSDTLPDYDSTGGVIIIPAGVTDTFLTVYIHADFMTNEGLKTNSSPSDTSGKEIYTVVLSGIQNAFLGTIGVDTIVDWNHKPSLAVIKSTAVTEGDSAVFHVMLNTPSATDIVFTYKTIGVTATPGLDYEDTYETTARSFTIRSGVVDTFIKVKTIDDAIQEDTETFKVKILTATDANIVDSTAIGTILDNDGPPLVSIRNDTVMEPVTAGASVIATFKVHFSAPSGLPMTLHWATVDSTAQSKNDPLDYQGVGGSIVMPAGLTDTTVSVTVFGDSLYEGPEYFKVHLYDLTNVALSKDSVGIGTILDNDLPPVLSITDDTVREGTTAKFTVSLNHESGLPVIFHWHTVQLGTTHGYAIAGKDYKDTAGVDTIAAGKLSIDIPVRTLADTTTGEGPETFNLQYTIDSVRPAGSSANLISATGDTIGIGTILDTNSLPSLSINSVGPLTEGKDLQAVFTVTLSGGVSAVDVNIHYTTQDGTAKAGKRYVASSGIVTIPAGQTSVTIPVTLINDTIRESHPETFNVILDSTDSARIVQPIGVATIIDTGDFPHLIVGNADTVSEGSSAIFPVTMRGGTTDTVNVYWHTVDGSKAWNLGEPAHHDSDYVAATGSLIFLPGQNQKSISVSTVADNVWEPIEVFAIKIDSITGADTAKGKALLSPTDSLANAWILDIGDAPTVTFLSNDTSVREDSADSVPVVVGLSRPASVDIKVLVPRQPGTQHEAIYGTDYTVSGLVNDTLVILAHDTTATFKVHVVKDSIDEYDETVHWKLQPFSPIRVGSKSEYQLTILDDDSAPMVSFVRDTQWIKEGASVNVVAHLNRPSGKDIQAWYRTSGTAAPGVDDDLRPDAHEEFFIKAGDTTASVVVHTVDDSIYEGTETMVFTIDSTVNATKGTPLVDSVFILDNDSVPVVSFVVADTTVKEDVGTVTLRIHLDHPAAAPIHVWIKAHAMPLDTVKGIYPATLLSNGNKNDTLVSTSNQADVALNGDSTYVVVIPSLDTSVTFSFKVLDDGRVEPTETFRLGITSEEANPKDPDSLQVHILDNDKLPAVKITSPADSAHLGKKNLDGDGKVPVTWTVDGTVQTPYDTLLPEGKSVIRKSYTDIWGNVGTDTITVWLDTTPPTVKIDSISKDGGKTWIAVDTPWVNVPGIIVKWHSIDDGVITWHQDSTKLTDTLNTISRCFEDAVGNKGCSSGTVGLDTTAPKVWITTPPNGSQWPLGCVGVTYYVQDMGTTTRHDTTYCSDVLGPQTITTPTYIDRAGNTAKGTTNIVMVPNTPSSAKYIDSDGDGRIDEVIVQFPAKVVGNLPSFEISYGTPGTNTISSSSVSYGSSSQAGNYYVVKGDTLKDASGKAVKVVEGRPVLGSDGQQLVDSTGKPVFASTGTPLLDAHGKQVRDTNGIPLWVAASGSAVDSSVLVVKLVPQFPYGWTSSTVTNLGVIKGTNAAVVNGQTVKQSWTDTFDIKDGVAPVIEKSEIHRTESYSGKDTLWIYPSEPLVLKSKDGSGIFQVSLDSGKTWIDVKVSSISSTGALQIILDLGSGVKPGVMVRFGDSVSDAAGNVVNHNTDTTKVVVQGPSRPDLIDVTQPSGVIQVNPSTGNSAQKGGFAFVASTGDTSTASMKTYQPGQGYSNAPQDLCPDYNQCSVTSLYINKASSVQMYIYDQIGTYIASTRFAITEKDIKTIQKDKLDRTQLKVLWNLRDTKGEQVISGIYLIRFVVRNDNFTTVNGSLENHVIKIGVKVN